MNRFVASSQVLGLLVVLVASGSAAEPNADQAEATDKIEKLGGEVTVDETSPGRPVIGAKLRLSNVTDTGLVPIELATLRSLDLTHSGITDAGLVNLRKLTELQSLDLSYNKITGDGLQHIKGLAALQSLDLSNTDITDAGLEHLERFAELQTLVLWRRQCDRRRVDAPQRFDETSIPGPV